MYIPENMLLELTGNDSRINRNLLGILSSSILKLNKKIELLADTSIQRKIAYALLTNLEISGNETLELIVSKQSWAEHLNISRPSLSRELAQMEDAGIIGISRKKIIIIDRKRLEEINSN